MPCSMANPIWGYVAWIALLLLASLSVVNAAPTKNECQFVLPPGWCTGPSESRSTPDCDGDGVIDMACKDSAGRMGTLLSSSGCKDSWPNAAASDCPAAFRNVCHQWDWASGLIGNPQLAMSDQGCPEEWSAGYNEFDVDCPAGSYFTDVNVKMAEVSGEAPGIVQVSFTCSDGSKFGPFPPTLTQDITSEPEDVRYSEPTGFVSIAYRSTCMMEQLHFYKEPVELTQDDEDMGLVPWQCWEENEVMTSVRVGYSRFLNSVSVCCGAMHPDLDQPPPLPPAPPPLPPSPPSPPLPPPSPYGPACVLTDVLKAAIPFTPATTSTSTWCSDGAPTFVTDCDGDSINDFACIDSNVFWAAANSMQGCAPRQYASPTGCASVFVAGRPLGNANYVCPPVKGYAWEANIDAQGPTLGWVSRFSGTKLYYGLQAMLDEAAVECSKRACVAFNNWGHLKSSIGLTRVKTTQCLWKKPQVVLESAPMYGIATDCKYSTKYRTTDFICPPGEFINKLVLRPTYSTLLAIETTPAPLGVMNVEFSCSGGTSSGRLPAATNTSKFPGGTTAKYQQATSATGFRTIAGVAGTSQQPCGLGPFIMYADVPARQGPNLDRTNLVEANLAGVNLVGANLVGANLVGANLVGANFDRTNLDRTNLDRVGDMAINFYETCRSPTQRISAVRIGHGDGKEVVGVVHSIRIACTDV